MKIYKYPLEFMSVQNINMPLGARILSVQMQGACPCIWAAIPEAEIDLFETREFMTIGTGHSWEENAKDVYIGTYQRSFEDGYTFVGHVFERTE